MIDGALWCMHVFNKWKPTNDIHRMRFWFLIYTSKLKVIVGFFFFRLQSWKLCLEGEGELRLMPPRRNTWEIKHPRPALFNEIHRDLFVDNCMNCGHWLFISFHDFSPKFWHFFWISWILLITLWMVVIISKKVVC